MIGRFLLVLATVLCIGIGEICADPKSPLDSTVVSADSVAKNSRLYDSIASKTHRTLAGRLLFNAIYVDNPQFKDGAVVNEELDYLPFAGKKINTITFVQDDVFVRPNKLEKVLNDMHVKTREIHIRLDLLFKEGDLVEPKLLVYNTHLMRSRDNLYDVKFWIKPSVVDPQQVDILVVTRDSWSIGLNANLGSATNTNLTVFDANFLGSGNRLSVGTSYGGKKNAYGGNLFRYDIYNFRGTFFDIKLIAGRSVEHEDYGVLVQKMLIKSSDYQIGSSFYFTTEPHLLLNPLKSEKISTTVRKYDTWAGRSLYAPKLRSSLFLTGQHSLQSYVSRAEVSRGVNPAFYNQNSVMIGMGIYRESFLKTNLIYNYGQEEDLPSGFKVEMVNGYRWGEFSDDWYCGANFIMGKFLKTDYILGGFNIGSYFNHATGRATQSAANIKFKYLSKLVSSSRGNSVRQYVNFDILWGWNRLQGADEVITFHTNRTPTSFNKYVTGVNRALLNTETIMFTPLRPLGFRMAFYGFTDMGLIGNRANVFQNDFFSTFGIGIRIKNPRLVFQTIQFRLGFAVGKAGWVKNQMMDVGNQPNWEKIRYRAEKPEVIQYE